MSDNQIEYPIIDPVSDPIPETLAVAQKGSDIPASFDAREMGWITPVKSQIPYGTCWAFASIAAAEASLIKSGLASPDLDLSEYALAYFTYSNDYRNSDIETILNLGGRNNLPISTFARWSGPVYESDLPYENAVNRIVPEEAFGKMSRYHLKNAYLCDQERIKEMILQYGAVATSYWREYSF